jgi:hypothetical protein
MYGEKALAEIGYTTRANRASFVFVWPTGRQVLIYRSFSFDTQRRTSAQCPGIENLCNLHISYSSGFVTHQKNAMLSQCPKSAAFRVQPMSYTSANHPYQSRFAVLKKAWVKLFERLGRAVYPTS